MKFFEVNFDGIVGPTHHYGGLSYGNVPSQAHQRETSYPRQAAIQGLAKMKLLADLGIPQAILPPHERPDITFLRGHGFSGTATEIVRQAFQSRPDLLSAARGGYGASDTTVAEVGAGERLVNEGLVQLFTLQGRLKPAPQRHTFESRRITRSLHTRG